VGEGVEVAEEGLGHGGEVGAATHVIEVAHQLAADPIDSGVTARQAARLEKLQVSQKLFAVEIREGLTFVWIHGTSEGWGRPDESNLVHFAETCQDM
jgi:hypothetical protein